MKKLLDVALFEIRIQTGTIRSVLPFVKLVAAAANYIKDKIYVQIRIVIVFQMIVYIVACWVIISRPKTSHSAHTVSFAHNLIHLSC